VRTGAPKALAQAARAHRNTINIAMPPKIATPKTAPRISANPRHDEWMDRDSTLDLEDDMSLNDRPNIPAVFPFEKILGVRKSKTEGHAGDDEFLVKWTDMSYMHAEWLDRASLSRLVSDNSMTLLLQNMEDKGLAAAAEEYFDQGYLDIERIIGEREVGVGPQYLVKWRAGDYDECTWEYVADIKDTAAIEQYALFNRVPKVQDWQKWQSPDAERPANRIALTSADSFKNGNTLREYQVEGANWLAYQWHHHKNCVLADPMGLGKTVQSVSKCGRPHATMHTSLFTTR